VLRESTTESKTEIGTTEFLKQVKIGLPSHSEHISDRSKQKKSQVKFDALEFFEML
jgi:hypothetical protein